MRMAKVTVTQSPVTLERNHSSVGYARFACLDLGAKPLTGLDDS